MDRITQTHMTRLVKPEHRAHVARLLREYRRLNRCFDSVMRSRPYNPADANAVDAALRVVGAALHTCGVR